MRRLCVNVKFAASQAFWLRMLITEQEYKDVFLFGNLGAYTVAFIYIEGATIMYDCESRQWLTLEGGHRLSARYQEFARTMTPWDRLNVQQLVRKCVAEKLDLGESE